MGNVKPLSFANTHRDFSTVLNKRVNEYFKAQGIGKHANGEMRFKTVFMFLLYLVPYTLILFGMIQGTAALLLAAIPMGLGISGIGLSVMHDANHGSYSERPW